MNRTSLRRPSGPLLRNPRSRAAILAAAGRIFAKSGLAGARTDAIAADAGVNKALLYYYFGSKEGLYEAVVEEYFSDFNRKALEVLNSPGSARAVLMRYVSLHVDFISAHHRSGSLFQQVAMTGGKFLKRLIRRYFAARGEALGKLIERGVRSREFRRVDGFQASVSIVSLIIFYFSASQVLKLLGRRHAYSADNLKRRKQHVLDFVRHGLFTDPNSPTP